jgi:hypothetical protein
MAKIFLYVEFQISKDFTKVDIKAINAQMKEFPGLKSKTWLSGVNNNSLGGFYEFDSKENAQNYIDNYLSPGMALFGSLTVKLFNGDITREASIDMGSPFFEQSS